MRGSIFNRKACSVLGFIVGASFIIIFGEVNTGLSELIKELIPTILLGSVFGLFVGRYVLKKK